MLSLGVFCRLGSVVDVTSPDQLANFSASLQVLQVDLVSATRTRFTHGGKMRGGGGSLQVDLHSWRIVWACLSSLIGLITKILLSHFLIGSLK